MKIRPECASCFLKRVSFQAKLADNGTEFAAVRAAAETLSKEFAEGRISAEVASAVHGSAYRAMGTEDPYLALKIRSDAAAEKLLPEAEKFIENSEDRLRAAISAAIAGNIMDFGSGTAIDSPEEFSSVFENLLTQGIGYDDTDILRELLKEDGDIVYIFDNCGESQMDILLIRELKKTGKKVTGIVRGKPVLNDVTREDAARIGLDKELDSVTDTGGFFVGIPGVLPEDSENALNGACAVIAKGMANYESLSERKLVSPVVFMLRAKCVPVADSLNVPIGTNVVKAVRV
ncbi:MAG: damage-control phosphatase ARMT1 family protein [Candidatus Methanomethylophilaceae archaeon]|jgi:uncharacterized protein with ATP-grasp and redox domains